jgi:prephenate dehydrogenase
MKIFKRVVIVGVGLIGGSIALAIKKKRLAKEVVGISRSKKTLILALKKKAIDKGYQHFEAVKGADLLIFTAPVKTIINLAAPISKIINPECIVSDAGSTKVEIVSRLGKLFKHYVGSHPLGGSEKQGVKNASAVLFKDTFCIFTPTKKTNYADLRKLKTLWQQMGSRVVCLSASKHDKILSYISHLPHAVAYSLMDSVPGKYLGITPTSLRDTTRIAASDSRLWVDIFLSNRANMLNTIKSFQGNLEKIKLAIKTNNRQSLGRLLDKARQKRISLENNAMTHSRTNYA